jgi:hypothetical protein
LLVEPAATNLLERSEEFDDAYWTKEGSSISANALNAPNGTLTADKLIESALNEFHNVYSAVFSGTSDKRTVTVYAKAGERDRLTIAMWQGSTGTRTANATFDLTNGTVLFNSSAAGGTWTNIESDITEAADGYYRCRLTANGDGQSYRVYLSLTDPAQVTPIVGRGTPAYLGNGTNSLSIWGAQLETGSIATSYIPTVAATATRNADVISKTGVSGFIGQTEGTVYAEVDLRNVATARIIELGDGTSANRILLRFTGGANLNSLGSVGGVNEWSLNAAVSAGILKVALAYAQNDIVLYVNGLLADSNLSANIPAVGNVYLGYAPYIAGSQLNDRIRAAAIYTTRLSNTELAALTSL